VLVNRYSSNVGGTASEDVHDDIPVTLGFGIPEPPPSYKDAVNKKNTATYTVRGGRGEGGREGGGEGREGGRWGGREGREGGRQEGREAGRVGETEGREGGREGRKEGGGRERGYNQTSNPY
jgi:hypothetical protein